MSTVDQFHNPDNSEKPTNPPQDTASWVPPKPRLSSIFIGSTVALAGCLAVLAAWKLPPFATTVVSTDNAYVRGWTTIISPQVSGYISSIPVHDYQEVRRGDVLVAIDERVYAQRLAQANANQDLAAANLDNNRQAIAQRKAEILTSEAQIASANAQLVKTAADLTRAQELVRQGSGTISQLDAAKLEHDVALAAVMQASAGHESAVQALKSAEVTTEALEAQVASSKAQVSLAAIDLGYTRIVAPEDGQLSDVSARTGQYVTNGTQLLFLVPKARWVTANFKEAETSDIKIGQEAWFTVDGLKHRKFTGKVDMISPAAGSEFTILRTDTTVGNFTKIPQRISVRISIDPGQAELARLRPGMSVEAYVQTAN